MVYNSGMEEKVQLVKQLTLAVLQDRPGIVLTGSSAHAQLEAIEKLCDAFELNDWLWEQKVG